MKKNVICILSLCYAAGLFASEPKAILDIYGTQSITVPMLQQSLGNEFQQAANIISSAHAVFSPEDEKKLTPLLDKIHATINKMGTYAYANISPVFYPGKPDVYFTIDVVEKGDMKRLSYFKPKPENTFPDPDHLIKQWQDYEKVAFKKAILENPQILFAECPVFHCISDFKAAELKPYKRIFMEGVPKNKDKLIKILYQDKDPKKRESAAFLLAHIKDGNELIKILVPAMQDADSGVRNNVMRVLGFALFKMKAANFPIDEAITALDYPTTTDRNKALMILMALAQQTHYATYIRDHAKKQLLAELNMQQENVHVLAYETLKLISGKQYGDRDYQAWEKWLQSA